MQRNPAGEVTTSVGPNWVCNHCNVDNKADVEKCWQCGAEKGSSPSRKVRHYDDPADAPDTREEALTIERNEAMETGDQSRVVITGSSVDMMSGSSSYSSSQQVDSDPVYSVSTPYMPQQQISSIPWARIRRIALVAILAILAMGIAFYVTRTHEVSVQIDGFSWSRTRFIDALTTFREEGWEIPAGGRYVSESQEVHHTETVQVGTEKHEEEQVCGSHEFVCDTQDNGDGTFTDTICEEDLMCMVEVEEPVYEEQAVYESYYVYDIDRWGFSRIVRSGGVTRNDPAPYWENLNLIQCNSTPQSGCERHSHDDETYLIIFLDAQGNTYEHDDDYADWLRYDVRNSYTLVINNLGMIVNDPLRPEQ